MPLPPRPFHSLTDIANRWSVVPIDLVGWAAEGLLALTIAAPAVRTNASKILCDLVEIAGTDVLPLFRSDGAKIDSINVRRLRPHGETEWHWISEPVTGIAITAPDVLIMRTEVQRFEQAHGLASSPPSQRIMAVARFADLRAQARHRDTTGTISSLRLLVVSTIRACPPPRTNSSARCSTSSRHGTIIIHPTKAP
jgi:hypothetical protein